MTNNGNEQQTVIREYRGLPEIDKKVFKAILDLILVLVSSQAEQKNENIF